MTGSVAKLRERARWLAAVCLAVGCVGALTACSNMPRSGSGSNGDSMTTPYDETDVRRRARIRLELAAGYFQRGQTAVALDEVKQVLHTDPSYADAYHLRALIDMSLGDQASAEENLRRAQSLKPGDPDILHNYGWLQCQRQKFSEAHQLFERALAVPTYASRSTTLMSQGICYDRAGLAAEAEQTLLKAYELDAANPIVGYNLAALLLRRGEAKRAQFYIRRVNNAEYSNAESLWLGVKVERALRDPIAARQLGDQLRKRFPDSKEALALERGAFDD
ncbi:MAG: type IV pilus biogenesis/stability protein PilW [Hyphomicrobiales bacterium]|nr:MAG: type IV pilus biogenesis/stability protein PilW [Hyphomicrobiales bacterium]